MKRICAIALCAGLSTRMGENKLLLDINGNKMFSLTLDIISACNFNEKIAVTRYDEIAEYGKAEGYKVLINDKSELGISTSIKTAVSNAGDTEGYMFFTCDQPWLREETVRKLIDTFNRTDKIVVPRSNGKNFSPCIFPVKFRNALLSIQGDKGGRQVYARNLEDIIFVDFYEEKDFYDVDTKEDVWRLL